MTEKGKYLYCIIQTSRSAPCNSFGIKSESRPQRFSFVGINNREVNLVHYKPSARAKLGAGLVPHQNEVSGAGDIAAVVSNTPVINFDRLDKKELTKHVTTHQQLNEEMMKDYDVVPMAFGIIAPSVDEVLRILEKAYLQFKTAFKNVAGKAEFAVQVWWDPKKLLEELANTNLEIRKLKQKASSRGSILGMPMKLKLGKLIQKEAEIRRQTFVNDIHAFLRSLSFDSTLNKLIDDEMIANFSFLIERAKESELDKKMQELGKKYEGKLRFKYIGPMPPYSFVNINLGLGNFELVNEARKLLGLGEEATFDEIKKAYYELARKYHPDKFQGSEEQMKKLARAYSILENYCQSRDEIFGRHPPSALKEDSKYSFKEEDVKNSIMIKYAQ